MSVDHGEVAALKAEAYDKLKAALEAIVTHAPSPAAATEMRCLAARALDDPTYWHLYREYAMMEDLRKPAAKT